jgi:hypothetical protein
MYPNLETQWHVTKMERAQDIARAERLAGLGWEPKLSPSWLKRLTGAFARQRSTRPFEREEALRRPVARGL